MHLRSSEVHLLGDTKKCARLYFQSIFHEPTAGGGQTYLQSAPSQQNNKVETGKWVIAAERERGGSEEVLALEKKKIHNPKNPLVSKRVYVQQERTVRLFPLSFFPAIPPPLLSLCRRLLSERGGRGEREGAGGAVSLAKARVSGSA